MIQELASVSLLFGIETDSCLKNQRKEVLAKIIIIIIKVLIIIGKIQVEKESKSVGLEMEDALN